MTDKKKTIDGRTEKEIQVIALRGQFSDLTDNQQDHYKNVIYKRIYNKPYDSKRDGGMVKGFSPIARPQRFKGVF